MSKNTRCKSKELQVTRDYSCVKCKEREVGPGNTGNKIHIRKGPAGRARETGVYIVDQECFRLVA